MQDSCDNGIPNQPTKQLEKTEPSDSILVGEQQVHTDLDDELDSTQQESSQVSSHTSQIEQGGDTEGHQQQPDTIQPGINDPMQSDSFQQGTPGMDGTPDSSDKNIHDVSQVHPKVNHVTQTHDDGDIEDHQAQSDSTHLIDSSSASGPMQSEPSQQQNMPGVGGMLDSNNGETSNENVANEEGKMLCVCAQDCKCMCAPVVMAVYVDACCIFLGL